MPVEQAKPASCGVGTKVSSLVVALLLHFAVLEDPRSKRGVRHPLINVLAIAVFGTMCGCNDAEALEDWGRKEQQWLSRFLDLRHGVPSQDVYLRVLAALDPVAFRKAFRAWVAEIFAALGLPGQVAVDGQTHRRSHDRSAAKKAVHMVHALWCDSGLVVGQQPTDKKSNEIRAIPELLRHLDLRGALVSVDAMGTQRKIAKQIVEQGGDYLMGLKGNQSTLHEETKAAFEEAMDPRPRALDEEPPPHIEEHTEVDAGHGRVETRTARVMRDYEQWAPATALWTGLCCLIAITTTREETVTGKTTTETRYYISSRAFTAEEANRAVRAHWQVENRLHYCLDVTFGQDACRARTGNIAENLGVIRHIALNILRNYEGDRFSVPRRRRKCDYDPSYRQRVLAAAVVSPN